MGRRIFPALYCVAMFVFINGCAGNKIVDAEKGIRDTLEPNSGTGQLSTKPDLGWEGSADWNARRTAGDILLFEDFEEDNYQEKWTVHWGKPVGAGTVSAPSRYVFAGKRSAYLESMQGRHDSLGAGEYVPEHPIDNAVYVRMDLRLEDGFSIGTANQLKLFGIRGGIRIEDTYGGAGSKPTGRDKFSVTLGLDNWMKLHFYIYHPDQRSGWGDSVGCSVSYFRTAGLSPGKWYCVELMLKNNIPGTKNGQLALWLDGQLAGKIDGLRFRDEDTVKIRRITVEDYFGGNTVRDTSPKNQRLYIDNFVVSTKPVGCFGRGTTPSGGGSNR